MQNTTLKAPISATENSNNTTVAPTPTLDELNQKVSILETLVNTMYAEISFKSFQVINITSNSNNLFEWNLQNQYQNYVTLRIDNPLCNNNALAKIFYSPSSASVPALQAIYYRSPYWYVQFYSITPTNLGPYDITDIHGISLSGNILTNRNSPDIASRFVDAIQISSRTYLHAGEQFTFAVFTPDLKLSFHGTMMNH